MSLPKTLEAASTECVSSKPDAETSTTTKKKAFKSISRENVQQALTMFLLATSMIDDDEEVSYFGVGDHFATFHFKTEKVHD